MMKLSKRLQTIADRVTPGSRTADIGSDHALLPVYLVQSGRVPSAIAGELNAGPYQAACKAAASAGLTAVISVRQGDGLSVLQPCEADTVTIAGMGGSLMADILEAGRVAGKLEGVRELVLQPNVGEEFVRRWLVRHGWTLTDETVLEEDGRFYEVLHAVLSPSADVENAGLYDPAFLSKLDSESAMWTDWLYRMGPHLLRKPTGILHKKWELEIGKLERILAQMAGSDTPDARAKEAAFRIEIAQIQEVLACTPTDKPSSN
ncbi:tRNA (adenine(22)-N(1))-methyltransferase [Paenibacillus methanolicus]|uniref:tRNA (Adenine22-N1)-methyltransferase n=1 Tax=Paenibacillus methanolicus TaxID=582686 RepID=A0A5S5CHK6_9BACL|nr:class I SAM-dependent methyltransferase [Paenibacillus methanolicus]TYP77992.1 tRNA (adenine22-N1)-methyltransferase [Paenibacillus methanolicus]